MDIQPTNQQPISDDQELAKVLAGVNQQANEAAATQTEDTPAPQDTPTADVATTDTTPQPTDETATPPAAAESNTPPAVSQPEPTTPVSNMPSPSTPPTPTSSGDSELDSIKKDALSELRPLVDKLNVSPEEKFDTYLLLLRSTDDKALIAPAHDAAKGIADEARRAQALLDIIKEIDYLAGPQQQTAS